jgi:glycosyltransferase involved in cell wall biosynthesis
VEGGTTKIRILFLYPDEIFGPPWTVFTQIMRHLDRDRFEAYAVINSENLAELGLDAKSVTILRLPFGRSLTGAPNPRTKLRTAIRSAVQLPGTVAHLARFIRRERIDIIQCVSEARASVLGVILAKLSDSRLLLHYHSLPSYFSSGRRAAMRMTARRADRAVAVSNFVARRISEFGITDNGLDVVLNGVDVMRFRPNMDGSYIRRAYGIPDDARVVLQVGRIVEVKRQADLVRAFAIARREVPELRCLIVGWEEPRYRGTFASYGAELRDICEREGLGDTLVISPPRRDTPFLFSAADIVCLPSEDEPWGLVVTEAMATGKAVIGSNSGAIPEQIIDTQTGFLVSVGDIEALADRLIRLARDGRLRESMGRAARRRAEDCFNEAHIAADFSPIYERLARSRGSSWHAARRASPSA